MTRIGSSIVITGEIISDEDVTYEGRLDGQLLVRDGALTIGERAQIQADLRGTRVLVRGLVVDIPLADDEHLAHPPAVGRLDREPQAVEVHLVARLRDAADAVIDEAADRNYIKEFLLGRDRELGRRYGVEYAEAFHYIGPGASPRTEDYIREHAVPSR